jgi:hypothetical protein
MLLLCAKKQQRSKLKKGEGLRGLDEGGSGIHKGGPGVPCTVRGANRGKGLGIEIVREQEGRTGCVGGVTGGGCHGEEEEI